MFSLEMGAYEVSLAGAPMKTLCHQWEVAKKDGEESWTRHGWVLVEHRACFKKATGISIDHAARELWVLRTEQRFLGENLSMCVLSRFSCV